MRFLLIFFDFELLSDYDPHQLVPAEIATAVVDIVSRVVSWSDDKLCENQDDLLPSLCNCINMLLRLLPNVFPSVCTHPCSEYEIFFLELFQ